MSSRRERDRVKRELAEARAKLQQTKKYQAEAAVVAAAMDATKALHLSMLGEGKMEATYSMPGTVPLCWAMFGGVLTSVQNNTVNGNNLKSLGTSN